MAPRFRAKVYSFVTPFGQRGWAYQVHHNPMTKPCSIIIAGDRRTWREAMDDAAYYLRRRPNDAVD